MKSLVALLAAFFLFALPAWATPVVTTWAEFGSSTSATSVTSPALATGMSGSGNAIIVSISFTNVNPTTITCSDTKSNTYTSGTKVFTSNAGYMYCWSLNATNLTTSDTITITFSSAVSYKSAAAAWVSGLSTSGIYSQGSGASGSSTTPSITTTSVPAGTLVFAGNNAVNGGSDSYTEDSTNAAWTPWTYSSNNVGAPNRAAYVIAASTGTLTHAPTLGTSRIWQSQWLAIAPRGAVTPPHGLLLTGVGK